MPTVQANHRDLITRAPLIPALEDHRGNAMPYNPLTGEGTLGDAEIADILTWITNGAVENE